MNPGDRVICIVSGVRGVITKIYIPTASVMQIMVRWVRGGDAKVIEAWNAMILGKRKEQENG